MELTRPQYAILHSQFNSTKTVFLFLHRSYYSPYLGYSQSKLANILFTYELQRCLKEQNSPVTANVLHPGVVNTDLFQHIHWIVRIPQSVLAYFLFKVRLP